MGVIQLKGNIYSSACTERHEPCNDLDYGKNTDGWSHTAWHRSHHHISAIYCVAQEGKHSTAARPTRQCSDGNEHYLSSACAVCASGPLAPRTSALVFRILLINVLDQRRDIGTSASMVLRQILLIYALWAHTPILYVHATFLRYTSVQNIGQQDTNIDEYRLISFYFLPLPTSQSPGRFGAQPT